MPWSVAYAGGGGHWGHVPESDERQQRKNREKGTKNELNEKTSFCPKVHEKSDLLSQSL